MQETEVGGNTGGGPSGAPQDAATLERELERVQRALRDAHIEARHAELTHRDHIIGLQAELAQAKARVRRLRRRLNGARATIKSQKKLIAAQSRGSVLRRAARRVRRALS